MGITYTVSKFHTDAAIIFITRVEKAIPMLILSGYDEGFPYYPPDTPCVWRGLGVGFFSIQSESIECFIEA
jgi:hypothetical protein